MRTPDHGECRRRAELLGLDAGRWPWVSMRDFLVWKLPRITPQRIDEMLADGRFVGADGAPLAGSTPFEPQTFVFFHRDLPQETPVPFPVGILHVDERILVVDKPHFLSSIPRGQHVLQSAVVLLRTALGMPELTVAHRLDRVTSGVLLLTCQRRWRRPYQEMFERRQVRKSYRVVAPLADLRSVRADGVRRIGAAGRGRVDGAGRGDDVVEVRSHIVKDRGVLQAREVPGAAPNAVTRIRLLAARGDLGLYEATPLTGRTHQIRLHFWRLGIPIVGDPFYPRLLETAVDDFSSPLQLQAHEMRFPDPVTGQERTFTSRLALSAWDT